MNKLLQSLDAWFKALTYPQKFTVITVIFVLPIVAFLPLVGNEVDHINRYGTNELFGTLYTRPLWRITNDLYLHEALSEKFAAGEVELSEVEALQATIDKDFEAVEARQRQEFLSEPYQSEVAAFKERWANIKASVSKTDSAELKTQHESLIADFNDLILRVGESSNLVLDPDLDTYYMKDIALFDMTQNQALTAEIYQIANSVEAGQQLSAKEQEQIASLLNDIEANMAELDRKTGVALENNTSGEMGNIITPALDEYRKQMQSFTGFVQNNALNGAASDSGSLLTAFKGINKANQGFYDASSSALQTGVAARVNSSLLQFYPIALVVLISIAAAFLLGQRMMGSISEPLIQLSNASQQLASGDLSARVEVQAFGELEKVSKAFNKMAADLELDKTSLTQRAKELETANQINATRAREFQFISEISQVISQEQKLEILLPLIARLVSEKFNFYHVGIFLTDDSRRHAILQATNSEGGQRMLNRGHRLELGSGIVGTVAQTGTARVALDVGADAVFFDNPDLPATRSEMAIPLNVRGETIGALDVQSVKTGEFTQNVVGILGILGDQVAIAIENARLFTRTQQALTDAQTLYSQYLQKEWKAFRGKASNIGYHQSALGGKSLEAPIESAEIKQAIQRGEIVVSESGSQTEPVIIVPIKLRGETIGALNIKAPEKNRRWSRDEVNMIESVSERLGLALENARLFEETNRRAERERVVSEITGKIRSVNDPQVMIQTALEELRNVLGASRVQVIPQTSAGNVVENQKKAEEV